MRITTTRRLSQLLFLVLFVWLCVVSTGGEAWFQRRGWPVNWLLQLDPLVAVGVGLAAGALTVGLLWALATILLTVLFGRVFCGWMCPFGTIHQFVGWLGRRRRLQDRLLANRYRARQSIKYYILFGLLGVAAAGALTGWAPQAGSLLTGLLDPIPLVYRSVELVVLPIVDGHVHVLWTDSRLTDGALLIGLIFTAAVLANWYRPRFFCRYVCPLGALLGIISRVSIFRIARTESACTSCGLCERSCEGACTPTERVRSSECVMCLNCLDDCRHDALAYQVHKQPGEITGPDVSRRGVLASLATGLAVAPLLRLTGRTTLNWSSDLIRPPGALAEADFLKRCIKCGRCMRACPTNVLQPAGLDQGIEALWTPALNNRIGTSGCQLNCVACNNICPTGALRPLSLDEKLGVGEFAEGGPVRLGTAFVDRGRCLPWAMGRPCIVCQENCPVSPKAIGVAEEYAVVRDGVLTVHQAGDDELMVSGSDVPAGTWTTGDYYVCPAGKPEQRRRILRQSPDTLGLAGAAWAQPPEPGSMVEVRVQLLRAVIDPARCIGCGVCEHECPVSGRRAIRITAENESRSRDRSLLI